MASILRVLLVTCVSLCLFALAYSADNLQINGGVGNQNVPQKFETNKLLAQRNAMNAAAAAAGVGGPRGDAAGGGNMNNMGDRQPVQFQQQGRAADTGQFQQNNMNVNPNFQGRQFGQQPNAVQGGLGLPRGGQQQQQQQYRNQQQFQQDPPKQPRKHMPVRITDNPSCSNDVATLCKNSRRDNFALLNCLQNVGEDSSDISPECNRFLWEYKMNLTTDPRFDNVAFEVCSSDIAKFPMCSGLKKGDSLMLPCLFDHAENITTSQCRQYITRMKAITFSDYMLIKGFYDECKPDIVELKCGTAIETGSRKDSLSHNQGTTINCLEKHLEKLGKGCKKQILRVAELTAEDYTTDRALYFACRDDRERFCESATAGRGAIYKCLLNHKFQKDMSEECRDKLTTRQKVISMDYKANYRLMRKCREDLKTTKCTHPKDPQGREFRLAALLICLETAKRERGVQLHGDCVAELEDTRKSLMNDYMINPEIITNCKPEINSQDCPGLTRGGKTLHCLMELTRDKKTSEGCAKALHDLVKTANAGANYKMDSSLQKACEQVRVKLCKSEEAGDAKVLSCLMENIYNTEMTKECESKLMLLQYFVSRDFKLDPVLYKNCKVDAQKICNAGNFGDNDDDDLPSGVMFACLHEHLHPETGEEQLSVGCQAQVHRMLRQRAVSVHLNPQIEASCRFDLGRFCTAKTGKGEELKCLQENRKELDQDCRSKIGGFTEEEAEDIQMNRKLMAACAPMIKKFCKDALAKKVDEGAALQCLIDHKNDDEMDSKCNAGIEHFQLIQLQDYKFNFKFKEACRQDVMKLCKGSKDKNAIVKCLSTKVRNDTLNDRQHVVSEDCRKQLKVELLQRSEDIKLDPELNENCKSDIDRFCSKLIAGNAKILECLRDHQKDLSETCHVKLFNRQKEQAQLVKTDYAFMHSCKRMIKQFCANVAPEGLFKCLRTHKNDPSFDSKCKEVLTKRSIEKKQDYRLNPMMQKACRRDMPKFCDAVIQKAKKQDKKELEGDMLQCLKKKFTAKALSPDCENYIKDAMQEASMDFRMDPVLSRICKDTAKKLCSDALETPGNGQVEECLKSKLHQGKIEDVKCRMQVIRLLQEGRADVHVDPVLYKACALDIKHYCAGIPQGEGRHMSCLLEAFEDSTIKLHGDCRRMIAERREMWSYAIKVAGPQNLQDLAVILNASEARGYFLTVLMVIIGILFFGGLCCGRVTKRVRAELKNK